MHTPHIYFRTFLKQTLIATTATCILMTAPLVHNSTQTISALHFMNFRLLPRHLAHLTHSLTYTRATHFLLIHTRQNPSTTHATQATTGSKQRKTVLAHAQTSEQ